MANVIGTRRGLALVAALIFAIAALGVEDSCASMAEGVIVESAEFTPYDQMRTKPLDPIVIGTSAAESVSAMAQYGLATVSGLPLRHTVSATDGSVYAYYLDGDLNGLTRSEFLRLGGIEFDQDTGDGSFAKYLLDTFRHRAVPVTIGSFEGAVTWGDPLADGVRPHGVYWSDGKYNYSLIADRSAADLVSLARDIVC